MAFLKSKPKKQLEAKNQISLKLGKIWSVINNLAQERRIRSDELDDFNQAFRKLSEMLDSVFLSIELMEKESLEIKQLKIDHSNKIHIMELCLELLGMSKNGVDYLSKFPPEFIETALSIRINEGKPIETEIDFWWLDQLWNEINRKIENDLESFNQAMFFKKMYHQLNTSELKQLVVKSMNQYAKDLSHLGKYLGKQVDENKLQNLIAAHWYEYYRHNTTSKI